MSRRPAPLSVRFSEEEKARLRQLAGDMPVGTYIRNRALDGQAIARRKRKAPLQDSNALGQVLALLGRSRMANNLNQLAKAANLGTLPVDEETHADIRTACVHVRELRDLLLLALGRSLRAESAAPLSRTFNQASREARP